MLRFLQHAGETLALLLLEPDWGQPVKIDLELPVEITAGLTSVESRRAFGKSARYSISYTGYLDSARASTDFRQAMGRLKGEIVAIPVFTDCIYFATGCVAGQTHLFKTPELPVRMGGEWLVLSQDAAGEAIWEIVVVTAINEAEVTLQAPGLTLPWPAGARMFPLLFGRFTKRPEIAGDSDETGDVAISIREDSPFSRRLNVQGVDELPLAGAGVPRFSRTRLWTIRPDYVKPLDRTEVDLLVRQIGFGREAAVQVYPQPGRRGLEMQFSLLERREIALIEKLFVGGKATVKNLMVPTFRDDLRLHADLPADPPEHLPIETSHYLDAEYVQDQPGTPYLALIDHQAIRPTEVATIDINGATLLAPWTEPLSQHSTIVSHLLLARFAEAKLSWTYDTDGEASVTVRFLEMAADYVRPEDAADNPPAQPAFLYRFRVAPPGGPAQVWRFTSYEDALTMGGNLYQPAWFSHGETRSSLRLDQEVITLRSADFPGNPLRLFIPFVPEAPLEVRVWEVDVARLDQAPEIRFDGEVKKVTPKGTDFEAPCVAFGTFFEGRFPNFLVQKPCNYTVYSKPCGANPADFRVVGTVSAIDAVGRRNLTVAGAPGEAGRYAGGWLEAGGQSRDIYDSTPQAGGQVLSLDRPVDAAVGQQVALVPGCDGSPASCRFFNRWPGSFGGHPFVPDTNPSLLAMPSEQASGGKGGGK